MPKRPAHPVEFSWYCRAAGVDIIIDSPLVPPYTEAVVDVETDEADNIVCIGFAGEARKVLVYFDITPALQEYLRGLKIVAHNGKADIGWLERFGVSIDQMSWDTMIGAYVLDSTANDYSLKGIMSGRYRSERPTYKELTGNRAWVEWLCANNEALRLSSASPTKKQPGRLVFKNPKKVTLDKQPREHVANYNGRDCADTYRLMVDQRQAMSSTVRMFMEKIELPFTKLLFRTEKAGIRVDLNKMLELHRGYLKEQYRWAKETRKRLGKPDINLNSPAQLKPALQEVLVTILPSTDEDDLQPYTGHPAVAALLEYRGFKKLCGTYTRKFYKLAKANPENRIHARFNPTGTVTGRISSSGPNMQNEPVAVKYGFVPKAGHTFALGDFSQIELRIPVHLSGEPAMAAVFHAGGKPHQLTADRLECSYKIGKRVNFLIANSGGGSTLVLQLKKEEAIVLSSAEGDQIIERFFNEFPVLKGWMDQEKRNAVRRGWIEDMWGRRVYLPDLRSGQEWLRARAERTAISVRVQGSAATLMKIAAIKIYERHKMVPVISEHDALLYEVPEGEAEAAKAAVKYEMENCFKLSVPLVADVRVGDSWAAAKGD